MSVLFLKRFHGSICQHVTVIYPPKVLSGLLFLVAFSLAVFPVLDSWAASEVDQSPQQDSDSSPLMALLGHTAPELILLAKPPFKKYTSVVCERSVIKKIRLSETEHRQNQITDEGEWFQQHDLSLPAQSFSEGAMLSVLKNNSLGHSTEPHITVQGRQYALSHVITQPHFLFLVYGDPPNHYGVVLNTTLLLIKNLPSGKTWRAYDFRNYRYGPAQKPAEHEFVFQDLKWVMLRDSILYVSHAHNTYAESSHGSNAYLTALDLEHNTVLWRSQPLVANANNFEVLGDVLICGYGFTAEPDYLYVLNRWTGDILSRIKVKSAPEWIVRKKNKLYVRCYDTDYVFRILEVNPGRED